MVQFFPKNRLGETHVTKKITSIIDTSIMILKE